MKPRLTRSTLTLICAQFLLSACSVQAHAPRATYPAWPEPQRIAWPEPQRVAWPEPAAGPRTLPHF
jgi:outer membrane biogenesis lipoprotein LolB